MARKNKKKRSFSRKTQQKKSDETYSGILEKNPKGFGFITDLSGKAGKISFNKDPFLSGRQLTHANHGDKLLIKIIKIRKNGRPEVEIIKILSRNTNNIPGTAHRIKGFWVLTPDDARLPQQIRIKEKKIEKLKEEDVVIIKPVYDKSGSKLSGKVIKILGNRDSALVQSELVREKFDLPSHFSKKVLSEAKKLNIDSDSEKRIDLRDTMHVTIDGATAKDFDDAICIQKTRKGFKLYVSIADVSHFVKTGSLLDHEAYLRGTSIYFPDRVIPMLPENISNNLCSLVPNEDRLTFTAILTFDRQGNRIKKEFFKSIINSKHRFTYNTVKQILVDKDPDVRRQHKKYLTFLKWTGELATELNNQRIKRGSIGFTIPEPAITLTNNGKIKQIARKERNFAHQIIEEFMLAANEAVAETFTENSAHAIYRIHEKPDLEKVNDFAKFATTLDLNIPKHRHDPDWFNQVLNLACKSPKEYVVNTLLLRTMKQAKYDTDNLGHFGLASTDYTHFTSPIRRFPDLIVHRLLNSIINKKQGKKKTKTANLKEAADYLSTRERIAVKAERDMKDRLNILYMQDRIGQEFKAIISGVNEFAIFVELTELFISGAIPLTNLIDDYYILDRKHHRFIGERTAKTFQLGDLLDVILTDIDKINRRINFTISAK